MRVIDVFLIGMACTFLAACSGDRLKSGRIEFKAIPDEDNKISFYASYASTKTITIDWGDGSKEDFTPTDTPVVKLKKSLNINISIMTLKRFLYTLNQ